MTEPQPAPADNDDLFFPATWKTNFRLRRLACSLVGGHTHATDGEGYLFCTRCYQSLTPEGVALGYLKQG